MFKKITWTLFALLLASLVAGALWWLYQREQEGKVPVELFIPDNSAMVLRVTDDARLPAGVPVSLAEDLLRFRRTPLYRVVDTLARVGVIDSTSITVALRVEGKESLRFLYLLHRDGLFNRGDLAGFWEQRFPGTSFGGRNFGRYTIYTLDVEKSEVYCAVVGGVVLLSNSVLYVEDALKRIDLEEVPNVSRYKDVRHYFSVAAGIHVFLNTTCFTELLPLYWKQERADGKMDLAGWFAWGALDGYLTPEGLSLNGFMHPGEAMRSFPGVLQGQRPVETRLDEVLPADVKAVSLLRLSDTKKYLVDLEKYRVTAGIGEEVIKHKREFARRLGDVEEEWQELFRGEVVKGVMELSSTGEEEGVMIVHLKSGNKGEDLLKKMVEHYARYSNVEMDSLRHLYQMDQKQVTYYAMPVPDFCSVMWGYIFDGMSARYAFIQENYLVLASSRLAVQRFARDYFRHSSIRDVAWYKRVKERLGVKHNWIYLSETASMLPLYLKYANGAWATYLREHGERLSGISSWGYQWSGEEGMLYTSLVASVEKMEEQPTRVMWQTKLESDVALKPAIVKNHITGERELLVQDQANHLYLISDAGLILWKLPIQGTINSEIYQVDFYRNGKLQYLFSTPTHLYLIDRNGAYLPRYPLLLRSRCEVGITLFDYEGDRHYRVAAPGEDRNLYLFELDGNPVQGWEIPKSDNPVVSKLYHFRIEQKDYLVFADRYRLYMLDRRGGERVKIDRLFDVNATTPLYLSRRGGQPVVLFADARQDVWWVGFEGEVGSWKSEKEPRPYHFNVGDVNADGLDEWIFTEGELLSIRDDRGQVLQEKRGEGAAWGFPYIYRFAARDARVGMLNEAQGELLLLGREISKGFPVSGTTPFSIAFHGGDGETTAGFYLFAGKGNYLLKYRVQQ